MPDLTIRMKKNADGTSSLQCVREDASVTWQVPKGAQGFFFAQHDLTHYAVETVLAHGGGFFGMIAQGWNITDFAKPWPRGPLPADTLWVELIVGFLDSERASGERWDAADFADKARLYYSEHGGSAQRELTDEELNAIRSRRSDLFAQWAAIQPGATLELMFNASAFIR